MYIHFAEVNLPKGRFVQFLFSSNFYGRWNPTLNRKEFYISNDDFKLKVTPLVIMIKQIPATMRAWDDKNKIWTIPFANWHDIYFHQLIQLFSINSHLHPDLYSWIKENPNAVKDTPSVEEFFYKQDPTANFSSSSSELSLAQIEEKLRDLLEINPNITFNIITASDLKKLYRQAALKFHPDRNAGDSNKMTDLNYYWQEYQKLKS